MLKKGLKKNLLESSIKSAISAVEVYNRPKAHFRVETYIALMIIAWTKLLISYFLDNQIKPYQKNKTRYIKIDGECKYWSIIDCINKCEKLDKASKENLELMVKLRNKIEHAVLSDEELEEIAFDKYQALLYNYDTFIIDNFGEKYAINENLKFAIQFSNPTKEQEKTIKRKLSKEAEDLKSFIEKYDSDLDEEIIASQKYSLKFFIIPNISNTKKGDMSIKFIKNENHIKEINCMIKEKLIPTVNLNNYKPTETVKRINDKLKNFKISIHMHTNLWKYYEVRPPGGSSKPEKTNSNYCLYDKTHKDYVYKDEWIEFISKELSRNPKEKMKEIEDKLKEKPTK